ncbi:MAG TPA: putative manganese-dependent inorganic diphosphatase [Ktedonobacter sp.]|jgi:manganese-dependent inorganic pyrophosphatase|nr:putative manganese-dependent inorganic diphosphatase [Ktedonobacter sp.]HAH01361.1 putative manganese-dependent inorganic diphosphatase [Ktedonobacter sp.]HBE27816.1 putative manganese-dependent inorganic diphosphatase [Ktedonobacter sp.]HCJ34814.1 putative manganese-dependent inorganic diphosphatase [Ktedonobacter sp.]
MARPIYVIGHKNSDLDSIASAYAYARLLQLQGEEEAIAARNGELKPEVRFVLERFQVEPPEAIDDVYLQVRDVMRRGVICAYLDQPLLEAGQLLQEHNRRSMPVVDADNKVHGIIATEDFAKLFFNDLDPRSVNRVPLKRDNLVRALRGRVLVEGRRTLGNRVIVGAMQAETMADYVEPGCLVVLGDRENAQLKAIESGAAALVITGDLLVSARTLTAAKQQGVMVISTAHHTFTAVRLINLSISTQDIMNREFDYCRPEDPMSEVQRTLARRRSMPVVDSEGTLVGYLSRTDILNARAKRVVLVDHNEQSQAVDGLDEAELLGIIDHHRIADVHTNRPIMFRADPVGCTGTIITGLYHEAGIAIPREVAGLLLAGLLYDTLILRSPTCTTKDERVAAELAEIAGEDIEQYGQEIFTAAAADLSARSAEALITSDFKEFTVGDTKFAIGTVETASPAAIEKRTPELLTAMQRIAHERGYASLLFMLVNIIDMECHLLIWGGEQAIAEVLNAPLQADGHSVMVEGLVSRKKQLVPLLARFQASMSGKTGAL